MAYASEFERQMSMRIADYDALRERIPDTVSQYLPSPGTWLDTGCGSGGSIRSSLSRFRDTRFTLADPSKDNLDIARATISDPRCGYVLASTDSLELPDASFDVITSILSSHYYHDKADKLEAFRNCRRMLREGGLFVIVEHTVYEVGQEAMDAQWRSYMEGRGLPQEKIDEMFARRDKVYFPLTEDGLRALLQEAGFIEIKMIWHSCSDIGFAASR
jgi:tRNA (cmo5U34)-methyltransferase